ncbi:MAG: hypothetical protein JO194_08970 [Candidatus Eremiobacteraeota bacterium]|nr:hypothetical protein [Candidatus Eremiobacteraeota bacterium]
MMKLPTILAALILACIPATALAIPHATAPVDSQTKDSLIPEGTFIRIRMLTALSSASSHAGDPFSWVVSDDVKLNSRIVVAQGTIGYGRVRYVSPAHGGNTPGFVSLTFYPISLTDSGRINVAITHASAVLDQNERNGYGPAADDVASMVVPYFFLFDALRKGSDMVIQKNAVFHIAVTEDVFVQPQAVAISATPLPATPAPAPGSSAAPAETPGGTPTPAPPPGTTGVPHHSTPAPSAPSAAPTPAPAK